MGETVIVSRELLQQALEALKSLFNWQVDPDRGQRCSNAIAALEIALAQGTQEEQEPVAFADRISFDQAMKSGKGHDVWPEAGDYEARTGRKLRVLYTHPPRREWQGLTDEIIDSVWPSPEGTNSIRAVAYAIEAKLKEKNNA